MRCAFHPRLINPPLEDPGLWVGFAFENRALLFDAGDTSTLSPRDLLKVTHVFISHTHMDHFAGFDRILRLFLGRAAHLHVYGPNGFLANLEGKLAAYTWNLVDSYNGEFTIHATEVRPDRLIRRTYACRDRFQPRKAEAPSPFDGTLLQEPGFTVQAAVLDHGDIPSLAFCLAERFHVNIRKTALDELGLPVGPWLARFKEALYDKSPPQAPIEVPGGGGRPARRFALESLRDRIAHTSTGQRIVYVADADPSPKNEAAIVSLARDCDHLFIEAAFLEEDADRAVAKHHLTARRAGEMARRAGAGQLTVFHFSPRYADHSHRLEEEARAAFEGAAR